MRRSRRVVLVLIGCAALLVLAPEARAQLRPLYRPTTPVEPQHMPGWDWWRIDPYSPYNYGRNPYNPAVYPYPYPYQYPYYAYPDYTVPVQQPDGAMFPSNEGETITIPQPTGPGTVPPPDAAIILVRVPDEFAAVRFDGQQTYTQGHTRYFVTPSLEGAKTYKYTVSANYNLTGQTVNQTKVVTVRAGHTTVVDFVNPATR